MIADEPRDALRTKVTALILFWLCLVALPGMPPSLHLRQGTDTPGYSSHTRFDKAVRPEPAIATRAVDATNSKRTAELQSDHTATSCGVDIAVVVAAEPLGDADARSSAARPASSPYSPRAPPLG